MEALHSSFFTHTPSLNNLTKKTRLRIHKTRFKCLPNPRIFARFGGPTKRRNSLRKKLTGDSIDPQVSPKDPKFNDPIHHFVDNQAPQFDLGSVSLETDDKLLGESVLKEKLEGWAELYKKEAEFWGIGFNPIFIVCQDSSSGKVDKVLVDEDEILRRNGVDPLYFKKVGELEEFNEVNSKISHARFLAREVENGNDVISRNSSVAKFVVSDEGVGGLVSRIRSVPVSRDVVVKVSRIGIGVVCGVLLVWMMKMWLNIGGKESKELSTFEKEMLRRKVKARVEREKMQRGSVEIVEEQSESSAVVVKRPQFDKGAVLDDIRKAKGVSGDLTLGDGGGASSEKDFRIKEIQMMARRARENEGREHSETEENSIKMKDNTVESLETMDSVMIDELEKQSLIALPAMEKSSEEEVVEGYVSENLTNGRAVNGISETRALESQENTTGDGNFSCKKDSEVMENVELFEDSSERTTIDKKSQTGDVTHFDDSSNPPEETKRVMSDVSSSKMSAPVRRMPKIIRSVKEAREYLALKNEDGGLGDARAYVKPRLGKDDKAVNSSDVDRNLDPDPAVNVCEYEEVEEMENNIIRSHEEEPAVEITPLKSLETGTVDINLTSDSKREVDEMLQHSKSSESSEVFSGGNATLDAIPDVNGGPSSSEWLDKVDDRTPRPTTLSDDSENSKENRMGGNVSNKESWLENNFHEMEPVMKKIGDGFRDSYAVAKEKVKEEMSPTLGFMDLNSLKDDTELEWMKDDKLRDIVFKVRDNELAGRDPFHSMDLDDKAAFFEGLESKVEKENQKLAVLHQWLHSNIENLDYGADGISIYDPPEKVIPKWKGPPIDEFPEFLSNTEDKQQKASFLQKGTQSTEQNNSTTSQEASITKPRPEKKVVKSPKTVIQSSDGSIKPGKKNGKEHWKHTKKWSRGFVESYNAETDPEMKATMKDIGKDLDRWITEKEIQEAADFMDNKIPQKGKEFIEKKISKLKREMELFGPQAVVSKYSEYSDEKEDDYLWWLDLPHVLCIELYTFDGEDQEVGFYTLEMAEDLELDPKPQHVIAFQDPGDCKNFCYIIQAHLEMLGKGKAFIVPQHPKDVFREAKANGFGVTVIKKGEVQLNVDQPLEEVEELISEIGSKVYHDKITKDRSVDISSLMKGVFGFNKPIKRRRKKRSLKRPRKP